MADLSKKYTTLCERDVLEDMKIMERYILDRYKICLAEGGSARVRNNMAAYFNQALRDLMQVEEEEERRKNCVVFVREEEEQKVAMKYKKLKKDIETSEKPQS